MAVSWLHVRPVSSQGPLYLQCRHTDDFFFSFSDTPTPGETSWTMPVVAAADWIQDTVNGYCFKLNEGQKLQCKPGPDGNKKLSFVLYFDFTDIPLHEKLEK
jgi:hypothetical protein